MNGSSNKVEEFLERLNEITNANLSNSQFGVSELAREMGMSRSNLHRKVHAAAKISVSQFINHVRLKHAMEMLRQTSLTVSEISWKTGFGSVSYFIKCFREYYGFPPGEVGIREKEDNKAPTGESVNTSKKKITVLLIGSSVVVLSVIIFFLLFPLSEKEEISEKTIAVLPFINDSMDSTNTYKINGLMGGIINNLSNNPNLIVRSRTSTENYRTNTPNLPEIARELNVNYIVGGSGQIHDSIFRMNIHLMNARTDEIIRSWPFEKVVNEVADIDDLQKDIVTGIVAQLNAEIKPGEKNWYKNSPAEKVQALYLFWEGQELQRSASLYNDVNLARQAKEKYEMALKLDSGFVPPMVQLGWICIGRAQRNFNVRPIYLDSAFYYARRAIKFDKESSSAYHLLGRLHHVSGNTDKAFESFYMALQYDKNESVQNLALLYFETGKYMKAIDLLYKQLAIDMETNPNENYWILYTLKMRLELMGFYDESKKYTDLILKQNNDSTAWLNNLMHTNFVFGNFDSVAIFADRWLKDDTLKFNWYQNLTWTIPWSLLFLRNYEESYSLFQEYINKQASDETISYNSDGLAFLYLKSGETEKADSAFAESIKKLNRQIELYHWKEITVPHILLASVYSAMGEKEKAIETLHKNKSTHLLTVTLLKYNPMFDNVRNEPEFQKILASIEKEYQKVHNQVASIIEKYENQN